jgi:hypothetical protein
LRASPLAVSALRPAAARNSCGRLRARIAGRMGVESAPMSAATSRTAPAYVMRPRSMPSWSIATSATPSVAISGISKHGGSSFFLGTQTSGRGSRPKSNLLVPT